MPRLHNCAGRSCWGTVWTDTCKQLEAVVLVTYIQAQQARDTWGWGGEAVETIHSATPVISSHSTTSGDLCLVNRRSCSAYKGSEGDRFRLELGGIMPGTTECLTVDQMSSIAGQNLITFGLSDGGLVALFWLTAHFLSRFQQELDQLNLENQG